MKNLRKQVCRHSLGRHLTLGYGFLWLLLGLSMVGCAEQESLHEHDHIVPPHWPSSPGELAHFLEERLSALQALPADSEKHADIVEQTQDLVVWAPEIAADTDIAENEWLPIYELSQLIQAHLRAGDIGPLDIQSDLDKLISLMRAAAKTHAQEPAAEVDAGAPADNQPVSEASNGKVRKDNRAFAHAAESQVGQGGDPAIT